MNLPNLASRPLLNTRPVWIVTGVAAALTLVLVILNLRLYWASNRLLAEQLARQQELAAERRAVRTEVARHVAVLERVPWPVLERRVDGLNVILMEHQFSWVAMLRDIEEVMPYEVRLLRIAPNFDEEGVTLALDAVGRSRDAMLTLIDNLVEDPRFSEPIPKKETLDRADGHGFQLEVQYRPEGAAP